MHKTVKRGRCHMSDHDVGNADSRARTAEEPEPLRRRLEAVKVGGERRSRRSAVRPDRRAAAREPAAGLPMVVPSGLLGEDRRGRARRRLVRARAALDRRGRRPRARRRRRSGRRRFVAVDRHRQTDLLAERARENARLEQTVSALNARLQAIEAAKGRDELAELRRSVGDMKTATATSRELSAAIAQLTQRVEKLDREQGAKLDKLGQRVDQRDDARARPTSRRGWTSSRRSRRRRRRDAGRPRRRRRNSAPTSRWTRPGRSTGRGRCCAAMSCSGRRTTSP